MSMMAYVSLAVLVIALVAFVTVAVLVVVRRTDRGSQLRREGREPPLLAAQGGLAAGLLAATGTGVAVMWFDGAHQDWLGLPLLLAPGLAASAGLLVLSLTHPLSTASGVTRSASLVRRGALTVGTRADYLRPMIAAAILVGVLLATGLTASADDAGLARAFSVRSATDINTASPYPGWFYAAPLLTVTALVVLAATLAMRRIATLPALESADEQRDNAWRRSAASAISLLATAGLLAYLAGVVLTTGGAIQSAAHGLLEIGGDVLQAVALLLAVLACVCFGRAIATAAVFVALLRPATLHR